MALSGHGGRAPLGVGLLVAGLYVAACLTPVSFDRDGALPGWAVLLLGWHPPLCVPWSANLFLLAGLVCLAYGWHRQASWLGTAAALLGLTSWALPIRPSFGYYLWQASTIQLALGSRFLASSTTAAGMRR